MCIICICCVLPYALWTVGSFAYRILSWDFCCCSSTCLFSSRPLSIQISPSAMDGAPYCPPLWFRRTGVLLSSCSEKVAVTICRTGWDEPMKNSTYSGIFHWDHKSGCVLWIFGWLAAQKYFTSCTVRCFGNILHRYNTVICHLKPFYIWNSAAVHESRLSCHTSV